MNYFLYFSDAAKFALVAKNVVLGNGFSTDFSFWGSSLFSTGGISRLLPYSIIPFFKIFGIGDFAVIASSFFYYLVFIIFSYLLSSKLFGRFIGLLSTIAIALNLNIIEYATSGASEVLFSLELVFAFYLISTRKKLTDLFSLLVIGILYFTRPQAFIFIAGLFLYWLLIRFRMKKGMTIFVASAVIAVVIDRFVVYPLSFSYPLTPVFYRGLQSIFTHSSFSATSDSLRGAASSTLGIADVAKKVFYNLYNFYKALPEIANPYLWGIYIMGLFFWSRKTKTYEFGRTQYAFKIVSVFLLVVTFLVTALTIPFYRYLHPIIPLVYIIAIATMVEIISNMVKANSVKLVSFLLLLLLVVGQSIGVFFLDSRFEAKRVNKGKPPVYAALSYKLKEETRTEDLILTNLDTWGSWYGERKTVWYPLTPEIFSQSKYKFDAIYLTNYKIDDPNYYMGEGWRQIFLDPKNINDKFIHDNFVFKTKITIPASETYEKEEGVGVLLVRKSN